MRAVHARVEHCNRDRDAIVDAIDVGDGA